MSKLSEVSIEEEEIEKEQIGNLKKSDNNISVEIMNDEIIFQAIKDGLQSDNTSVQESRNILKKEGGDAAKPGSKQKTKHEIYPDLDTLLGFGKFQHFQIWVFQTIVATLGALSFLQLIYIVSDPPDWYCSLGEEKCPSTGEVCGGGIIQYNTTHDNYLYSLPVQHNWICDQSLRGASVITATAVGSILNSIIFGQIVDKIGRRATVHVTNILSMLFRLISFHVTDHYYLFLALTALGTNFFPVGVRAGYTLVTEFCNERGRKFAFISGWVWWVVAMSTFPFLAEYVKEWYTLGISVTLVHILVALMYPFVPESPRLLYCQKKYDRAAEILNTVRRVNGDEPIPEMEKFLEKMGEEANIETETLGVVSMFRERNLLRLLVCMATLYSVNDYFYFAGLLNAQNLAGNMFLNQALLALTELPSVFIGQYIIDRFGRRWSHVFCMVVATSCFLANLCIINLEGMENAVFGLSLTAKGVSNIAWFIMWVQSIEVFPTCVRNTGINLSVVVSLTVSMTTPFTMEMDSIDKRLPYAVFVSLGVIGTIAAISVPETKGISLPESIDQVNAIFRRMRIFQLRAWKTEEENKPEPEEIQELKQIN